MCQAESILILVIFTMKVITDLSTIQQPFTRPVVTIGNFDGVHKGHQAIFHQVIEKAESLRGTSVAMTFEPHPMRVLKKKKSPPLITLYEQKKELIEKVAKLVKQLSPDGLPPFEDNIGDKFVKITHFFLGQKGDGT